MSATISTIASATLLGVDGWPVTVEVHVSGGLPGFTVVGQPDGACREARDRVRAAVQSSGLTWHPRRYTVNLAPTGLRKVGAALDLAMAIGVLVATEQLAVDDARDVGFLGELGLDGTIRKVPGALSLVDALETDTVVVPRACAIEAQLVDRHVIKAVSHLAELVACLRGDEPWPDIPRVERRRTRRRHRCRPGAGARSTPRPAGARGRGRRWPSRADGWPTGRGQDHACSPASRRVARPRGRPGPRGHPHPFRRRRAASAGRSRSAATVSCAPSHRVVDRTHRRRLRTTATRRDLPRARGRAVLGRTGRVPALGARRAAAAARGGCGPAVTRRRQGRASRPFPAHRRDEPVSVRSSQLAGLVSLFGRSAGALLPPCVRAVARSVRPAHRCLTRRSRRVVARATRRMLVGRRRTRLDGPWARAAPRCSLQRRPHRRRSRTVGSAHRRGVAHARDRVARRQAERPRSAPRSACRSHDRRPRRPRGCRSMPTTSPRPSPCAPIRRSSSPGCPADGRGTANPTRPLPPSCWRWPACPTSVRLGSTHCSSEGDPEQAWQIAAEGRAHLGPAARVMGKDPAALSARWARAAAPDRPRSAVAAARRRRCARDMARGRRLPRGAA